MSDLERRTWAALGVNAETDAEVEAELREAAKLERWKADQRRPDALPVAADLFPDLEPAPKPPPPAGTMANLFD